MIRTPPRKTVNFSTDLDYMVKLFNEYDRLIESLLAGRASDIQKKTIKITGATPESTAYHPIGFQLLTALLQLPHIDIEAEVERRTSDSGAGADRESLRKRIASARYWLDNFATDEDRVELQMELPESVATLSHSQRAFLHSMGVNFPRNASTENDYQRFIFDMARLTPLEQPRAFQAIYRALLDKDQGPKGGALLSYLDSEFLIARFLEINYSRDALWNETGVTQEDCETWLAKHRSEILDASVSFLLNALVPTDQSPDNGGYMRGKGVIDIRVTFGNTKQHMIRVLFTDFEGVDLDLTDEASYLDGYGSDFIKDMVAKFGLKITQATGTLIYKEYTDAAIR